MLRLTIILMAFPIIIYLAKPGLMPAQVYFSHSWTLLAPVLLLLIFVILLFLILRHRYTKIEYNWLFTLSALFICVYLILFYIRLLSIS